MSIFDPLIPKIPIPRIPIPKIPFIPPADPMAPFLKRLQSRQIPGTPVPVPNPTGHIPGTLSGTISGGRGGYSSIDDILRRLEELQNPDRYMADLALLEQQARGSVNSQYDPIIAELRNQMASAQSRAGRNSEQLGQMFASLSNSLQADIPTINQTYENTKQNTQAQYDRTQGEIADQYAQSQAEQEALLKRLNIEAAAPDTLPQQMRDRDYFENLSRTEAQTAQTAIGQEQRGAVDYTQRGSQIARMEGTNRQADLMSQLEELLSGYESQIGAQSLAKQNAYSSTLAQLQQQMQEQALSRSQRDFENYIKEITLGRQLRNDELQQSQIQPTVVKSPADVASRALEIGLPQNSAQNLQNVFMTAVGSDPTILAGIDPNFGTALPKEALAARILEAGRNAGLSQPELNALQTIALEYFGRR